jgi:hypothetical protein
MRSKRSKRWHRDKLVRKHEQILSPKDNKLLASFYGTLPPGALQRMQKELQKHLDPITLKIFSGAYSNGKDGNSSGHERGDSKDAGVGTGEGKSASRTVSFERALPSGKLRG